MVGERWLVFDGQHNKIYSPLINNKFHWSAVGLWAHVLPTAMTQFNRPFIEFNLHPITIMVYWRRTSHWRSYDPMRATATYPVLHLLVLEDFFFSTDCQLKPSAVVDTNTLSVVWKKARDGALSLANCAIFVCLFALRWHGKAFPFLWKLLEWVLRCVYATFYRLNLDTYPKILWAIDGIGQ